MENEPLRMCIACRCMKPKSTLIKIVKNKDGSIDIDANYNKDGRGAYICKNVDCLELLNKKKLLNKAFKSNIDDEIYLKIKEFIDAK